MTVKYVIFSNFVSGFGRSAEWANIFAFFSLSKDYILKNLKLSGTVGYSQHVPQYFEQSGRIFCFLVLKLKITSRKC